MTNAERQKRYRDRRNAERNKLVEIVTEDDKSVTGGVTVYATSDCPEGYDKKMWDYACERARRARNYARKMPGFIRPGEERFQYPEWQYQDQTRYPLPAGLLRD